MAQRNTRLIAGVYQVGQVISTVPPLVSYSAYNRNTNDVVGLLVIDLAPSIDPVIARQALAPLEPRRQVQSPHVISVFNWGVTENKAYIVTDPPRGITLRQLMDTENIDLARSLDLAMQMTRGVVTLQTNGITDTDLRPQLITVDTIGLDDRVQIDDVGLRSLYRQLGYMSGQNTQDVAYFDPRYMTPEQLMQDKSNEASEVYLLGILLFELVTGRPPFVGRTPTETGMLQTKSPVPTMAQFKHTTPPALQAIVQRAMAKDPQQRYPHAQALLTDLEAVSRSKQSQSRQIEDAPQAGPSVHLTGQIPSMHASTSIETFDTLIIDEQALHDLTASDTLLPASLTTYAYLDLEREGLPTERIPLKDKYVIVGRVDPKRGIKPEIDLTAFDPQITVSRQHARIRFEKTFFYVEDLKSSNKTRLGELVLTPLKPELLQHGDTIWFGALKLVFRLPDRTDQPLPPALSS